jgi:DNA polymerase I-like protein with 3'-5' exonuclease and polymerase domains
MNYSNEMCSVPLSVSQLNDLAWILPQFEYVIYHNGKFDIRVLNRVLGVELVNSFDTMLAHHVLNHAAGDHKLKHLAKYYFGAEDWEGDIKRYLTKGAYYEHIPRRRLVEYNGYDVYWTYKLYELFKPLIEADENNQKAFMLEMSYADFLLDVENVGIPFDTEYAKELAVTLEEYIEDARGHLRSIVGNPKFNPGSHVQIKKYLLDTHGVVVASTDVDNIEVIIATYPA